MRSAIIFRKVLAFAVLIAAVSTMMYPDLPSADGAAPGNSAAAPESRNSLNSNLAGTVHGVPLFPSASDALLEGFVRVINRSDAGGEVNIAAIDDAGLRIETPVLSLDANETAHFNSDDLEQGNAEKGLTGGTGAGTGDWRLELSSDLDIEVLAYIRTEDGLLTAMHDVVERGLAGHRVAIFNPGRNRNQRSLLRLINPGTVQAGVTISGIDDAGMASDATVAISLPAGGAKTISAAALESEADRSGADENGAGFSGVDGALGPGAGKWQLMVTADHPVLVMSLLMSPTGHLTNLSTAPYRSDSGAGVVRQMAENTEPGAAIGEPVTADLGTGAELTHVLQGPDAESFDIDESSGQLRAREGVTYDFETRTTYALIVNVTDGVGGVVRIPVTVEVTDADEPPGKPAPPEVEGVSSRSVRVSWEEPENTGPAITDYDVEYRRPGPQEYTDAEHEGIERETGIEHLRQGTDYEFRVRASNEEGTGEWSEPTIGRARSGGGGGGGGGGGTAPPPNRAPVFQGPSSFTLPENRKEVGAVRASGATAYSIDNGGDGGEFQIDDAGALQFQSPPDYERPTDVATSDPPDAARNNTYIVAVVATNSTATRQRAQHDSDRHRHRDGHGVRSARDHECIGALLHRNFRVLAAPRQRRPVDRGLRPPVQGRERPEFHGRRPPQPVDLCNAERPRPFDRLRDTGTSRQRERAQPMVRIIYRDNGRKPAAHIQPGALPAHPGRKHRRRRKHRRTVDRQ